MKITVAGSFHEPNWTAVRETVKKLEAAGHTVLAPGSDWEPINNNASFIKFKGEENTPIFNLEEGFLNSMLQSDVFVICNANHREGYAVSFEFGFATAAILSKSGPLKKICFTNPPLGYDKFKANPALSMEEYIYNLFHDPSYHHELSAYENHNDRESDFHWPTPEDMYIDMKDWFQKMLVLDSRGAFEIGLDSLLNKNTGETKRRIGNDDYER